MNEPLFPCTNALQTPNPPFWTTKTVVPKFPQNGGSTPTPCLDKAVHAQGGGGGKMCHRPPRTVPVSLCSALRRALGGGGEQGEGSARHPATRMPRSTTPFACEATACDRRSFGGGGGSGGGGGGRGPTGRRCPLAGPCHRWKASGPAWAVPGPMRSSADSPPSRNAAWAQWDRGSVGRRAHRRADLKCAHRHRRQGCAKAQSTFHDPLRAWVSVGVDCRPLWPLPWQNNGPHGRRLLDTLAIVLNTG